MRLIDADALMEIYADRMSIVADRYSPDSSECGILSGAMKLLSVQPTIEPEPHWIPCIDRMPEDGERVFATHLGGLNPDRQVIEHIYKNGEFTLGWDMDMNMDSPTFGQRYMGKVVAWMPKPKPYLGG